MAGAAAAGMGVARAATMSETAKTVAFAAAAAVCIAIAWLTAPSRNTDSILSDRGQPFFAAFTDPNAATSLEVIEYDPQRLMAKPFKVLNRDGRWVIPSHDNYPADAGTRLASIAAAIIALRKDDIVGETAEDAERCGVLDPADETLPTPRGRGTRVTVRGSNETVLADVIIGSGVEGQPNLRYVRVPEQKRIYMSRVEGLGISTTFQDWIERNLLLVERSDIDQILIRSYTTDATTARVTQRATLALRRQDRDRWTAAGLAVGETVDSFTMNLLVTTLVDLRLMDVRRKPPNAVKTLSGDSPGRRFLQGDVADLATKGFYFTAEGEILSNRGEVVVHTASGIFYVLRFGEVAHGVPDSRYVFVSVGFDPAAVSGPMPSSVHERLEVLRARFAPWYYLVGDADVQKIQVPRVKLIVQGGARQPD
jgi:hypothetical protein